MLSKNSERIKNFLESKGLDVEVKEILESTRTAAEAADAIGCKVDEIAKSILFKGKETGKPVLVIASGSKRINEKKIEAESGEKIVKADAEFVKRETGFPIGGVPPFGHENQEKIKVFVDNDLMDHEKVWAAAGTPNSVFRISPKELVRVSEGKVMDVS